MHNLLVYNKTQFQCQQYPTMTIVGFPEVKRYDWRLNEAFWRTCMEREGSWSAFHTEDLCDLIVRMLVCVKKSCCLCLPRTRKCVHAVPVNCLRMLNVLTNEVWYSYFSSARLHSAVQEQAVTGCVLFHQLHRSYGSLERVHVPAYVWKPACWTRVTIWAANSPGPFLKVIEKLKTLVVKEIFHCTLTHKT